MRWFIKSCRWVLACLKNRNEKGRKISELYYYIFRINKNNKQI